jgi:potassium-transporting ATPase KdpC subunit
MPWLSSLMRGLRATAVLWLLTVVVTTLPMLAIARLVAPDQAEGSLIRRAPGANGEVVGSRLIGQPFQSRRYLQSRPAGAPNLAPSNPELRQRVAAASTRWQGLGIANPAADLLQDSASGVDPHISLAAARAQLPALAQQRGLPVATLERLLRAHQQGPLGGQSIETVVDVLGFNLALDQLQTPGAPAAQP